MKRQHLSAAAARRIALAAQSFGVGRPDGATNAGHVRRAIDRLGLLQIDSVNVLARAHYLPLFSRLGAYDSGLLDRLAWGPRGQRALFEFWAHEASLLPLDTHPLWRWRMERAAKAEGDGKGKLHVFARENRRFIDDVRRQLRDRGPLAASELEGGTGKKGPWWGWSDAKYAMEWLFFAGEVTTATRRGAFERVYDLTERVLPAEILSHPTPSPAEAQRELLRRSGRALGVATEFDLRDYYRLGVADTKARLAELVEAGDLLPVAVEGWTHAAYLDHRLTRGARQPRRIEARALLAKRFARGAIYATLTVQRDELAPVDRQADVAERLDQPARPAEQPLHAGQQSLGLVVDAVFLGQPVDLDHGIAAGRPAPIGVVHAGSIGENLAVPPWR